MEPLRPIRGARYTLGMFAIAAFIFGSRWTFILPHMANIVLVFFWGIL